MNKMNRAKQEYDQITIPKELSERVQQEINLANEKRKVKVMRMKMNTIKKWGAVAAVIAGAFIVGLNTSQSFAQGMSGVPVLGQLAKVLTFREYEEKTDAYEIKVEIPTIEMISEDFNGLEEKINAEILAACEQYAEEAKADAESYREAFLATGGTEEEWADHDIQIKVWYEVKEQTEKYLSLAIKRTENWSSAGGATKMFNIDLQTGEEVDFETVMGETYYEDSFAVEPEVAEAYAAKIQAAVAEKDIEALADLTAFPVYVGYVEEGIVVETREDFAALGAEAIFTEELMNSVANADFNNLSAGRAGFILSAQDAASSIIYNVVDGQLKITGIN